MGSNFSIFEIKSYFSWRGCEVAAIELVDQIIQVSSSQRGLKYPEVSALVVETKHPARNYSSNTQSLASTHLALYAAGPTFYFRKIVFHLSIRPSTKPSRNSTSIDCAHSTTAKRQKTLLYPIPFI